MEGENNRTAHGNAVDDASFFVAPVFGAGQRGNEPGGGGVGLWPPLCTTGGGRALWASGVWSPNAAWGKAFVGTFRRTLLLSALAHPALLKRKGDQQLKVRDTRRRLRGGAAPDATRQDHQATAGLERGSRTAAGRIPPSRTASPHIL